jgi:hypothetical protein
MCSNGWSGPACNIKDCPRDSTTGEACNGQGYCENILDIYRLYGYTYGEELTSANSGLGKAINGKSFTYPATWDAQIIHQCLCYNKYSSDEYGHPLHSATQPRDNAGKWSSRTGALPFPGFTSWDCSQKLCPKGTQKRSSNSNFDSYGGTGTNVAILKEKQRIVCTIASTHNHWFWFTFYGQSTARIYADDTIDSIKAAIEQSVMIGNVTIEMDYTAGGTGQTACDATNHGGSVGFVVTFDTETQNLPLLSINVNDAGESGDIGITGIQDGNSENLECNGDRAGYCDRKEGLCRCRPDRGSSNHNREIGNVGDCGYVLSSSYSP